MPDIVTIANPNAPTPKHPQHDVGIFHSFCEYPTGITFQNQAPDEVIVLFVRRHFATNIPWMFITFLLLIAPPIIIPFFQLVGVLPFSIPGEVSLVLLLFYYLIIFAYAFTNFLHWFYNIGIVTERNILDIDYSELVNVHISATKVTQIEDVSYKQGGFFKTFFDYGDVHIQTAAAVPDFEFLRIPHPARAVDLIRQLIGLRR
ncbi:MAG: hypothetical protein HYV40_05340 [Candidatus Levybacteria bacterium]|nr:hypothetical protein [Candidatus Levybacteria bacterium]